jgi:hypothetical protein
MRAKQYGFAIRYTSLLPLELVSLSGSYTCIQLDLGANTCCSSAIIARPATGTRDCSRIVVVTLTWVESLLHVMQASVRESFGLEQQSQSGSCPKSFRRTCHFDVTCYIDPLNCRQPPTVQRKQYDST